jgi:lysyl-tRNA synthetase class 2
MANNTKISERDERAKKLEELEKLNINPYPAKTGRNFSIKEVLDSFEKIAKEKIIIAGRLKTIRIHGNLIFANLDDGSGTMQLALSKKEINDSYSLFVKNVDMGDFIEAEGDCFITHKGEKSILVKNWKILTKSLRPLPDKWHGLKDDEEILRKRYLDILFNPEIKDMIVKKDIFWNSVRDLLKSKGFVEVETPVLETTTGGADARPFITHHNALNMDVYLRISMGELWQKRLMVAGLPKTFEIGRQFRNEGMDAEHLQDYTQMEFYQAYADYRDGMALVEELFKYTINKTFGTLKFKIRGFDIDLSKKWELYDYQETVKKFTGVDILKADLKEIEQKLKELKVDYDKKGFNITRAIDNLWKYCRKQIAGPGFLVGVPVAVSPLAKKIDGQEQLTQRFQPIIAGSELGNGYSELNDPIEQASRFDAQQTLREAGDEEAQMNDRDFVEALEYGMPPTCGFGMSERVFAFFMNKSMRECQIFPLMKPKANNVERVTHNVDNKDLELGISYDEAKELVTKYNKDKINNLHYIETEAIMRALAKHFGEDEEKWGIIGLLHDIDWELTKNNTERHCLDCVNILKEAGGTDFLIQAIQSHAYGQGWDKNIYYGAEELRIKKREGRLEHALAAAETITGLIISTALINPDKKLASVKVESLKKKFKNIKFAANCNREIIKEIEETGLSLDDFFELSLKALQNISDKLGL